MKEDNGLDVTGDKTSAADKMPANGDVLTVFASDAVCSSDVFRWSSHSPERRAETQTTELRNDLVRFCKLANDINGRDSRVKITQDDLNRLCERYVKLVRARWSALSRCASAMITGPTNFPTSRNQKAQSAEHKRMGEVVAFYEGFENKLLAIAYPRYCPSRDVTGTPTVAERTEYGIRIIENQEVDRLQLIFEGRPGQETVALLKSRGFKWSPRFTAWQRQLTDNARAATRTLLPKIAELEAA